MRNKARKLPFLYFYSTQCYKSRPEHLARAVGCALPNFDVEN